MRVITCNLGSLIATAFGEVPMNPVVRRNDATKLFSLQVASSSG